MPAPTAVVRLRRCALAVSVLHDLDLLPSDAGVILTGAPLVAVQWSECQQALQGADPETPVARQRLAAWLAIRRWLADHAYDDLTACVRPVGAPIDAPWHPGPRWVMLSVPGGALDLGLGLAGLDRAHRDDVVPVTPGVLAAAGLDAATWWPRAMDYLERMGGLAAARQVTEGARPLRPMGDCDVVTLLASAVLRAALVSKTGGMRTVAAPMRTRGWTDLSRIDPAFVKAAAELTDPPQRGFSRALLVTAEEVVLAPGGGDPAALPLRDESPDERWPRDVRWHPFGVDPPD